MAINIIVVIAILTVLYFVLQRIKHTKSQRRYSASPVSPNQQKTTPTAKKSSSYQGRNISTDSTIASFQPITTTQNSLINKNNAPECLQHFELLFNEKLTEEQLKSVNKIIYSFRRPHPLLLPLTQRVFEPTELFDLIKTDPEMTAKILNVVNSAAFGLKQPITSINHAIVFMGVSSVKNIAMRFAMQNSVEFSDQKQSDAYQKIWRASYISSSIGLLLAKTLKKENASELSTHCLLSYLGNMAMLSYHPDIAQSYLDNNGLLTRVETSQSAYTMNSAITGATLAKQWDLPKSIVFSLENSLLPLSDQLYKRNLSNTQVFEIALCYLSNRLAELVVFNDIFDFSFLTNKGITALIQPEFYFLNQYVNDINLEKINACFNDQSFIRQLNALTKQH